MSFRITPQVFVSQAIQNAQRHTTNLSQLQQQAATGLRLLKPSDDPEATFSVLARKGTERRLETELSNIQAARAKLNLSVSQLLEANTVLVRGKDLALQGNQSRVSGGIDRERETLANQVDTLIDRLLSIVNTEDAGQFLFAGSATNTTPFTRNTPPPTGTSLEFTYNGTAENKTGIIGDDLAVSVLYSGAEAFQGRSRGSTVVIGATGAATGTGTDSGVGAAALTVSHTATTFAAGSGVLAGASSANGDTIIGPAAANVLTINDTSGTGASGTVSLNGGATVAFTSADTNLQVTGPLGEVIFVNTTAITPGFSGNIDITATGTLSTDGGATTLPINFSANQVVTNSQTGQVTNIDSSAIRRVGVDQLEYAGTADALGVLVELRNDLRNTRNLTQSELEQAFARRIGDFDRIRDQLSEVIGEQSATLENLDALEFRAQDLQLEVRRVISELESADISEVVLNLQAEQNLLQFTFAASAGLLDLSLLNFIR